MTNLSKSAAPALRSGQTTFFEVGCVFDKSRFTFRP